MAKPLDRLIVVAEVLVGLVVIGVVVGQSYGVAGTVTFTLGLPIAAMSVVFIVRMFTALSDPSLDLEGAAHDPERERLEREKKLLLAGLREFETDAAIGKVDKADYEHLKRTAEARAVQIIKNVKDADAMWLGRAKALVGRGEGPAPVAPAPKPTPRAKAPSAHPSLFDDRPVEVKDGRCAACDTENPAEGRYCIGCGRPRAAA